MRLNEKDREAATKAVLRLSKIVQLSKSGYSTVGVGGEHYPAGSPKSLARIRDSAGQVTSLLVQLLSGAGPTGMDVEQAFFPHSPASARGWIDEVVSRRTVLDDMVDALDEEA